MERVRAGGAFAGAGSSSMNESRRDESVSSSELSTFERGGPSIRGVGAFFGMAGPIPTAPSPHGGGRVTAFLPACAPGPGTTIGGATSGAAVEAGGGDSADGAPP